MTSATKVTRKSSVTGKSFNRGGSPDLLDEAATMQVDRDGSFVADQSIIQAVDEDDEEAQNEAER